MHSISKRGTALLMAGALFLAMGATSCKSGKCETVKGDPMATQIYTLDNGLKVYLSVNKETPRIQTYIAVRTGGKNDPADNTGLAHYLEHIMFKGTEKLGTSDYAAEKPMLDQIQKLYDVYRTKTDPEERKAIYHQIDSISYEASKIAIPNEYDKAMSIIGARGTNAFTSNDVTCYQEDIPSNQVENWLKIEADRFKNMVIRGFHTELEAVYEEYNRGLTSDTEKAIDAIDSMLFPSHPYGTQTVIGTQQHLKNPDITAIKKQKATYYVPNNTAICMAGDFDPKQVLKLIRKYFGDWKPNPDLPTFTIKEEAPITQPKVKDVTGNDFEFTMMAWRAPGDSQKESLTLELASSILQNGTAGLIDLDVIQKQRLNGAEAFNYGRADYGMLTLFGMPKQGQSLQEVRDILLEEVDKLRKGDFDEALLSGAINNFKLGQMRSLERNGSRAMAFVNSFVNGTQWKDEVEKIDNMSKVTKDDIVAFANKYLGPDSYAIVYKHTGNDPSIKKIEAPKITAIETNRDKQSAFLREIQDSKVPPIEPVFVDFSRDMSVFQAQGLDVLYKKNENNDIASVTYLFETGTDSDPVIDMATSYIDYLGTPTRSAEQIARELYNLACSVNIRTGANQTAVSVSGLSENLPKALEIMEDLIRNATPDEGILENIKSDMLKTRAENKLNQRACASALQRYMMYGPEYIRKTTLTNEQVAGVTSEELLSKIRDIYSKWHKVLYYGPQSKEGFTSVLEQTHKVGSNLEKLTPSYPVRLTTPEVSVLVANYPSRQFNYRQYSNRGEKYDPAIAPQAALFNEYFGGSMNSIVFQEMREARGLAYSAGSNFSTPSHKDDDYTFSAMIGSQNDKLSKSVEAFQEIIENMPETQANFDIAKSALDSRIRTSRVVGQDIFNTYLAYERLGIKESPDKMIFEKLPAMTMDDLKAFHEKWIKGRTYTYCILGEVGDLDMDFLEKIGPVKVVSLQEIFGY